MEKRIKIKSLFFLLHLPLILAVVFVSTKYTIAEEEDLVISEIMYYSTGHSDWIELYNPTGKKISIKKNEFGIIDEKDLELGSDEIHYKNCHGLDKDLEINSKEFLIITSDKSDFESDYPDIKSDVLDSAFSLSSDGDYLKLSNDKCATFFIEMSYEKSWGGLNNKRTIEKKELDKNYKKDAWQESYVDGGTPGEKNSEKPKPKEYPSGIYINELLPNPAGSDEEKEYIEIYNPTSDNISLYGWILKDKSSGKYTFPKNSDINSKSFLTIYRKDFSFAINNSDESIYLIDPNEKIISEASFSDSAKEDIAYAYDTNSSAWRWTSKKTPDAKNDFDKVLSGKIKKDDPVYVGIYAKFSVATDKEAEKFIWDFGDGHKSYLKDTQHKYEKTGNYDASLKITGNGEAGQYLFTVKVEKYNAPKVRIVSFSPNPKGIDSKNEWLTIENKSKKKIDLQNWSIATGWDKLTNHPIREKFTIKSGKSKKLSQKICAFTLNNTKNKIELRDPSGKVVQKIKYDRTTNKIEEDEIYQKEEAGWNWLQTEAGTDETPIDASNAKVDKEIDYSAKEIKNSEENTIALSDIEIREGLGKFSEDPIWTNKKDYKIILLSYNTNIKTPAYLLQNTGRTRLPAPDATGHGGQVAGASTERNIPPPQKHWLVELADSFLTITNSKLNWILNKIL